MHFNNSLKLKYVIISQLINIGITLLALTTPQTSSFFIIGVNASVYMIRVLLTSAALVLISERKSKNLKDILITTIVVNIIISALLLAIFFVTIFIEFLSLPPCAVGGINTC